MLKLFKNISIYTIGSILNKGAAFLLLPIYTQYLTPADYGQLAIVMLAVSFLSIVFGLNIESGYVRIYFDLKNTAEKQLLFASGQMFNLICALIFSCLIVLNSGWVVKNVFTFTEGAYNLTLVIIITAIEVMTIIPLQNLRIRQKARAFVFVSLLKFIIIAGFTIGLVAFAEQGVVGVLYSKIIGGLVVLILLYFITSKEYKLSFSVIQIKLMLGFSVFLIPANLSALILNMSNRFFLQEYQNVEDVGMYSLGANIAGIIPFLFTEPVQKAFSPYLLEKVKTPKECKRTLADFTRVFFAGLSAVALIISLFAKEVIDLMADVSYSGSHNVVFVLSASYLLHGLLGLIVLGIHISRKTWVVTLIWVLAALVNIAFNIWLIPVYGRMGAAVATLLSVIVINVTYFYAVSKVYPTPFEYKKLILVFVLMILFNYIGSLIVLAVLPSILLKLFLLSLFFVAIYFSGIIKKEEVQEAREFVLSKFKK